MDDVTRRTLVGAVAAGTATAVAGCTGDLLDDDADSSDETDAAYEEWLAADLLVDMDAGTVIHADLGRITDSWPEEARSELGLDSLTDSLGVSVDDIDGMLVFQTGRTGLVLTGSFDRDAVVSELAGEAETETVGDYEVVNGAIAIGSDALVMSADYETLIDARNGDVDRISDVDEEWDAALSGVAGAAMSGVMFDDAESFELMGIAMDADGSDITMEARTHYADAETAEAEKADAEAEAKAEFVENGEIQSIRVDGNVVVIEAVLSDFQF
ncbi:hypothetical protein Halru_2137 [Halovivax ruber XH-70]|uniref:Uncharacterized protein n=1 Tax=Halovivax ruber (strain DSM 18193 / JCM 13892 / XH-70) TaxID=797302 RepID=L0IET0_HALRX|nr:hypothetical protein [Halovivax ruber]AGB16726.1 hypothetical protein Halru_2137 [Halovivax ruber XH-70]